MNKKVAQTKDDETEDWEDIELKRNQYIDDILNAQFQLTGIGSVFQMGKEPKSISHKEICYVLSKLARLGYASGYQLLPLGWEPEMLYGALTSEEVASLVPIMIQAIEHKVIAGTINIYAENNRPLLYCADVMGWYWFKKLRGPRPEFNPAIRAQHMAVRVRQNAPLVCPLCQHQFMPPAHLVTQQAKAWWWLNQMPKHFVEYHRYKKPGSGAKKKPSA
jgi:hypothetical protein